MREFPITKIVNLIKNILWNILFIGALYVSVIYVVMMNEPGCDNVNPIILFGQVIILSMPPWSWALVLGLVADYYSQGEDGDLGLRWASIAIFGIFDIIVFSRLIS